MGGWQWGRTRGRIEEHVGGAFLLGGRCQRTKGQQSKDQTSAGPDCPRALSHHQPVTLLTVPTAARPLQQHLGDGPAQACQHGSSHDENEAHLQPAAGQQQGGDQRSGGTAASRKGARQQQSGALCQPPQPAAHRIGGPLNPPGKTHPDIHQQQQTRAQTSPPNKPQQRVRTRWNRVSPYTSSSRPAVMTDTTAARLLQR